ncbi:hypothetical protein C8F01DRAFT_85143 [Mycena amicta]|nr:hypothetical protein C8F01DRAFT_85143 [Mycena amicta]
MTSTTMSSLPVELVAEIFTHSLPKTYPLPSSTNSPLLVMRVCRLWRDIAVTTPSLWCNFYTNITNRAGIAPFVKMWLSRSQSLPLTIRIDDSFQGGVTQNQVAFYREICRHAGRWLRLTLNVPFGVLGGLSIDQPLEMLEELTMGLEGQVDDVDSVNVFAVAPRLRMVDITLNSDESVSPSGISLPWSSLTTFFGELFHIDECIFVLREAANLLECHFRDILGGRRSDDPLAPLRPLYRLEVLNMEGQFMGDFLEVLSLLTLPALKTLSLGSPHQDTLDYSPLISWTTLEELWSRSSCSLTRLNISANKLSAERLLDFVRPLPSLEHLEIFSFNDEATLRALHQPSDEFLPRLRALIFHSKTRPTSASYETLIRILFVRTSASWAATRTRIERFEYIWSSLGEAFPDKEILDRFKVLRSRGLRVHLGPPHASCI